MSNSAKISNVLRACVVGVVIIMAAPAFAGTELREIGATKSREGVLFVRPFCIAGKQFVAAIVDKDTTSNGSGGIAVVQVMETVKTHLPPQPMACREDSREPVVWK